MLKEDTNSNNSRTESDRKVNIQIKRFQFRQQNFDVQQTKYPLDGRLLWQPKETIVSVFFNAVNKVTNGNSKPLN
jgi:hypothetical protein